MVDKSKHIENIQKILVGSDNKRFHTQFEALSTNVDEIEAYFHNAIELSYKKLHHKLEQSTQMLEQKINHFVSQSHSDKTELRTTIYSTIEALEDQIFNQKNTFLDHTKKIKEQINESYHLLHSDIAQMNKELEKLLESDTQNVSKQKISNELFSQTLLNGVRSIHANNQSIATHQLTQAKKGSTSNPLREYIEQEKKELKDLAQNINQEKKDLYQYLKELKDFKNLQTSTTLKVMNEEIIDVEEIEDKPKSNVNPDT